MSTTLFLTLVVLLSGVSALLTQGIKVWLENANKPYCANLIALIDAIGVGGIGSIAAYILMSIPFTLQSIVCIFIMIVAIWLGSMIGYDKVIQFIRQMGNMKEDK